MTLDDTPLDPGEVFRAAGGCGGPLPTTLESGGLLSLTVSDLDLTSLEPAHGRGPGLA